jgi:putative MATE family efflux protein
MKKPNWLMRKLEEKLTTSQFTAKQIVDLYIPMMLDQLSIYIIGILSSAMVSASSQEAISATSLVNSLAYMVTALFTAMSTGGTVLVAQAKGRGDAKEIRQACGQTIFLTTAIGFLGTFILFIFASPIVNLLFGQADPIIIEYGLIYLKLYGLSFMPFALFNSVVSCFRGMGAAKECLVLTIVINGVHLIMSFVFINICQMGITGSGLSFIVARVIGALAAAIIFFGVRNIAHMRFTDLFRLKWSFVKNIFRLAFPFAIEQMLFNGGQLMTSSYVSRLSNDAIAANGIAASVNNLFYFTAFSMQNLIMTVCGQCIGAKHYDLARRYINNIIKIGRFLMLATVLVVYPLLPLLMLLYQPTETVAPLVYQLLAIGCLALPTLWCDANLIPAGLRSAGDATFTTIVCLLAMWVSRVALGYFLTITMGLGIHAVWAMYFVEAAIRAVIFRIRFKGTKWQKM